MFDTTRKEYNTYNTQVVYTPPDRLLTAIYKDKRKAAHRKFERLDSMLEHPTIDNLKRIIYKMKNENIWIGFESISRRQLEEYLEYREQEGL